MAPVLASCPRCSKLFSKDKSVVCPKCAAAEEADYDKIRELLASNTTASIEELVEKAGVSFSCVMRMLDQGVTRYADLTQNVTCGVCGKPAISPSKRICQSCLRKLDVAMATEVAKVRKQAPPSSDLRTGMAGVHRTIEQKRSR